MKSFRVTGVILFLLLFLSAVPAQQTIIRAARLLDVERGRLVQPAVVVVEENKIVAVNPASLPAEATVIDLGEATLLPGLMDMHTHLSGEFHAKRYMEQFYMDEADLAYRSTVYARRTLLAGFTTVRELGGNISNALRDAIAKGWVEGPRIFSAGKSIATTGGHADPTSGLNFKYKGDPGPAEGVVNGVPQARKAVRQRYKNGADLIKITATGGVLSTAKNGQNPQFTMEELRAIIETANDYGMHVAAHAHGAEGIRRAIVAGVRSIEHGSLMDEEGIRLMKKHGTWYVPTLTAGRWVAAKSGERGFFPPMVAKKAAAIGPKIKQTFRKAHEAGVKIAFGTDSGVSPHGENADEFIYMVEGGMTPVEVLQSATKNTALLLEVYDRLGSIAEGKIADIVAVPGNPLEDIRLMKKVSFVMKEGQVYKQP